MFSQLKGNTGNVSSTFSATGTSQKVQSARPAFQPLVHLRPHIPASSPTDSFLPSSPHPPPRQRPSTPAQALLSLSPHVCFHQPHVTGLPILPRVSAPQGGRPCPGPSFSSFSTACTALGHITSTCLTFPPHSLPATPSPALSSSPCLPLPPLLLSDCAF